MALSPVAAVTGGKGGVVPRTPPVVYLGPSASVADIRAALPEAVIRPPARRGDLHRDRLLRYSVFLLIDGVFNQEDAVSPREVVDILQDGAVLVGASSMGALRATDCAPLGAQGTGTVYRLFRGAAVNSEDEVAVMFNPEAPFPALSESLVNMRVALRRAVRARLISKMDARRVIAAAAGLHFSDRSWRNSFRDAALEASPDLMRALRGVDVKRTDARASAAALARTLAASPGLAQRPRRVGGTFGLLGEGRERSADPLRGLDAETLWPEFALWLIGSARIPLIKVIERQLIERIGKLSIDLSNSAIDGATRGNAGVVGRLSPDLKVALERELSDRGEADAEWFRFIALRDAHSSTVDHKDLRRAEAMIAEAHGAASWAVLLERAGLLEPAFVYSRDLAARGMALRRIAFDRVELLHERNHG